VVIVSVTRSDLREEIVMAEEAFALSPISARAALPSEEDYAAISEAFMETSRGRWFLGEYARRNRNADTRMVLDAVARIEEGLAAQRRAAADAIRDEQLEQALAALRGAVEAVQGSAIAALDNIDFEQTLAPVRKGVRVIREISWRLREIGNDGRICDIIDSQANAIEAGAAQLSLDEAKSVVDAAFATLARRLADYGSEPAVAAAAEQTAAETPVAEQAIAETPAVSASPSPMAEQPAPDIVAADVSPVQEIAVAAPSAEAAVAEMPQPDESAFDKAEAALAAAEAAELARAADEAAADAHDEAVLDLIAMEMGAPDAIDDDKPMIVEELGIAGSAPAAAEAATQVPVPEPEHDPEPNIETAPVAEAALAANMLTLQPASEAAPATAPEISLGSTIIASGLVKKPNAAANDPLAPIHRMSQAEKIAFFS
jgi:hypothetical protein